MGQLADVGHPTLYRRQRLHDLHRADADRRHALHQVEDVARVACRVAGVSAVVVADGARRAEWSALSLCTPLLFGYVRPEHHMEDAHFGERDRHGGQVVHIGMECSEGGGIRLA